MNGKEALKFVEDRNARTLKDPCLCPRKRKNYKLIFMDCNMPIMDGFQATTEIRKYFDSSQIHIAALTAYASDAFEAKCRLAGMDTFLTKPISEEKIKELVK